MLLNEPHGSAQSECPVKVAIDRRVATSHSLMVVSLLSEEAKVLTSGLKATKPTMKWRSPYSSASPFANSLMRFDPTPNPSPYKGMGVYGMAYSSAIA